MRSLTLFSISLSIGLLACDFPAILSSKKQPTSSEQTSQTEALLSLNITGGLAGVDQQLVVDKSGKATYVDSFRPGANWVIQLTSGRLDTLTNLFLENDYFHLDGDYLDSQVADAFHYAISFNHNNMSKAVLTDNIAAPANLQRIVEGLIQLKRHVADQMLALTLQLSAHEIMAGEEVELTLLVTNKTEGTLSLHFWSGQI